jgi:hypothetical protein
MEPTSNNAQKSAPKTPSDTSSSEYLAAQIADARLALESTLDDMTLDLARAADLRRWVRRYPWAALGTALVAGFTVAHIVTKSKRRHEAAATTDEQPPAERVSEAAAAQPVKKSRASHEPVGGWRAAILYALFDILRLAVTQFVAASVRQAASKASHPHETPGHDGPAATQHSAAGDATAAPGSAEGSLDRQPPAPPGV